MQINSPWFTTWCSVIIWGSEHVHKCWDEKEKVANVELFKFGSGQEGFWGTLIKITFAQTCTIWSRWMIRPFEHVHKVWEHLDMFGSVKLLKLQNGQKWFWGDLMMLYCSPRHDTCQDHQTCHIWHARIFLEFFWEYFLCKYFKSLKYPERVFEGFDQYFEHDHVLKLLYMDNICPMSFPKFCQIFLKQ